MTERGISFRLVPSLSLFSPHALPFLYTLSRCPPLSLGCPDNLRTNLVPLSPPLRGDKVDKVGSVYFETPQPWPLPYKGISLGSRPMQFASRSLLSRESISPSNGKTIPSIPNPLPKGSFDL